MALRLLLAATLLLVSPGSSSAARTLPEIVGQLSTACREGGDSSAAVEDIRTGQDELEDTLADLQKKLTPVPKECPYGWSHIGDSCYLIPLARSNWFRAQHFCAELDPRARLASIPPSSSREIDTLVRASTASSWGAWIGLVRLESGSFGWSNGSPLVFTDWNEGEPSADGNCVHIWGPGHDASRGWNDLPCSESTYILCQITLN